MRRTQRAENRNRRRRLRAAARSAFVPHRTLAKRPDVVVIKAVVRLDAFKRAQTIVSTFGDASGGLAALPIVRALLHCDDAENASSVETSTSI